MKDFKLTHKKTGKDIKVIVDSGYLTVEYEGGPDETLDKAITKSIEKLGYEFNGSGWCMSSNVRDIGFTIVVKDKEMLRLESRVADLTMQVAGKQMIIDGLD